MLRPFTRVLPSRLKVSVDRAAHAEGGLLDVGRNAASGLRDLALDHGLDRHGHCRIEVQAEVAGARTTAVTSISSTRRHCRRAVTWPCRRSRPSGTTSGRCGSRGSRRSAASSATPAVRCRRKLILQAGGGRGHAGALFVPPQFQGRLSGFGLFAVLALAGVTLRVVSTSSPRCRPSPGRRGRESVRPRGRGKGLLQHQVLRGSGELLAQRFIEQT